MEWADFFYFFQKTTLIGRAFLVAFVPKILQYVDVQWQENSSLLCPSPASLLIFHSVTRFPLLFPTTKQMDSDLRVCFTLLTRVSCPWQQELVMAASMSPCVHWDLQLFPRNQERSQNSLCCCCCCCSLQDFAGFAMWQLFPGKWKRSHISFGDK